MGGLCGAPQWEMHCTVLLAGFGWLWGGFGVVLGGPLDGSNTLSFSVHHPWVCTMFCSRHSHVGRGPGRVGTSAHILVGTQIIAIPS